MTNKDTTPTSGAADLPEALCRSTAADGKTELFNLPGYPLMVRAVDFNRLHTESEMRRTALLDEMQKAALAAGQATAPQGVAYAALPEKYYLAGGEVPTWAAKQMHAFADRTHALRMQASPKAAPGEPSDADIDAFLDSPGGIEWVIADKRERYRLLVRAVLAKWAAPQQEAQAPCPTCAALARTVMLDQVSFDRKPDCYGIRQITDDEGVEEWEDIRTSPDVAREEANDMMATGRGEIYKVVPLYTAPQPAPAPLSDGVVKDAARWHMAVLIGNELMMRPEKRTHATAVKAYMDATHSGSDLTEAVDAALAAQGGK